MDLYTSEEPTKRNELYRLNKEERKKRKDEVKKARLEQLQKNVVPEFQKKPEDKPAFEDVKK